MIEELLREALDSHASPAEPAGLVDTAVRAGYRRRRQARLTVAAAAVFVLALPAGVAALRSGSAHPVQSLHTGPAPSSPAPTAPATSKPAFTPTTVVATTVPPGRSLTAQFWPVGNVMSVLPDGPTVVVAVRPDLAARVTTILRLDPTTGKVLTGGVQFDSAVAVVRAGNWLWLSDWPIAAQGGHYGELVQLDPATLAVHHRVALPEANPASLAAGSGLLWAGGSDHLYRIDPDSGAVLRTVSLESSSPDDTTNAALDPSGQWLWVAQADAGSDPAHPQLPSAPLVVSRRDPLTGALQAERRDLPAAFDTPGYHAVEVLPVSGGVWVPYAAGANDGLVRLDGTTLATVATWGPTGTLSGHGHFSAVDQREVFVFDPAHTALSWADIQTGVMQAALPVTGIDSAATSLHVVGGRAYIGTVTGLAVAPAPTS